MHYELTMKRKKTNNEEEKLPIEFCTECGEALDDFAFTPISKDKKAIQDNFSNCQKTGKFKGECCSKVFISEDEIFLTPSEEE